MKAVITAAGKRHRHLPVQTMTDPEGFPTSTLRLQLSDLTRAGVKHIGMVINPGDEALYREAAGDLAERLVFIEQTEARGYGHAVLCAREFVGDEPFVLTVSDHLFISGNPAVSCAGQVIEAFKRLDGPISAVQPTHEREIGRFGTLGVQRIGGHEADFKIERIIEKPTPTLAEQQLVVPGLRSGYYYCFFGIHVFTPEIFPILEEQLAAAAPGTAINLSDAHNVLARRRNCCAVAIHGHRYDLEARHGLLLAQLALALNSPYREELLASILTLLAK